MKFGQQAQSASLLNVHRKLHLVGLIGTPLKVRLAYRVRPLMLIGRSSVIGLQGYLQPKERVLMSNLNWQFHHAFDIYIMSLEAPTPPLTPTPGYETD